VQGVQGALQAITSRRWKNATAVTLLIYRSSIGHLHHTMTPQRSCTSHNAAAGGGQTIGHLKNALAQQTEKLKVKN
jgi:hypothetical protein